jgi:Peptidase A4 family
MPAIGVSAVALSVGPAALASADAAAGPAHSVSSHLQSRGNVMLPSTTPAGHLAQVSPGHHGKGGIVLHDSSDNWSGYAASGGSYPSVSSNWVQPSVNCGSEDTYSSFWVGLDGDGTDSVEQTGTEADCSGGSPQYSSWYEMYPAYPVTYSDDVEPGDSMSASVTTDGSGNFTLTITDNSQGWTETQNQSSSSAQDGSAEVIAEAPYSNGVLPLSDFGTVDFTGSTVDGSALGDSSPDQIDMVSDGGVTEATTSGLDGSGQDFGVTWDSSGS